MEDDKIVDTLCPPLEISIHVLRVEDDVQQVRNLFAGNKFQSTSSVWRTTGVPSFYRLFHVISIHVLRVEDD